MSSQPLYDLSPALRLMLLGAAVALGPLAWVWLRHRDRSHVGDAGPARRLRALTLLTLFLTFDLVLFGAFTRLTDSGLGCPDWPGCYGAASPVGARASIGQAEALLPGGPVTPAKAWIEMTHRYFATGVGVLITMLAVAAWWQRHRRKPTHDALSARSGTGTGAGVEAGANSNANAGRAAWLPVSPWWPTLTLAWVCLQGAFGALTVTMKLFPAIVTLHLLGGMVLLALLCRQAVAWQHSQEGRGPVQVPRPAWFWLVAAYALLWLQIALGGWVSANYAVLACDTFPGCQNSAWPAMDFRQGFEIWRELGKTGAGENLGLPALTAIHYAHRLMAYLLLPVLALLAWRLRDGRLRRQAGWMAGLAAWQLATGLSNVVLGWPLVAAVSHTGGAAALVIVLTWTLCASCRAPARSLGTIGLPARGLST